MSANLFVNSANANEPVIGIGNAVLSTAQSRFGTRSLRIPAGVTGVDNSRAYLIPRSEAFRFGSQDFTLEFFYRLTDNFESLAAYGRLLRTQSASATFAAGISIRISADALNSNKIDYSLSSSSTVVDFSSGVIATLNKNQWHHLAITRSGTTFRFFVDGSIVSTYTSSMTLFWSEADIVQIGSDPSGLHGCGGFIDEMRVTKGVARYTSTFTPPTTAFPENSVDDPNWSSVSFLSHFESDSPVPGFYLNPQTGRYSQFLPPAFSATGFVPVRLVYKRDYGGRGRIYGTVKVKGTPNYAVSRPVRLFRDKDGVCLQEVWSDPITGAYEFVGYDMAERYTVIAYDDPANSFRAVVADNLAAELMA